MYNLLSKMQKNIILIAVIIMVIGIGFYFILTSVLKERPEEVMPEDEEPGEVLPVAPPVERHEFQGMKYEIIGKFNMVYDIITGELTEEQVEILAEKIIDDIIAENSDIEEITLLFYSDLIAAGAGEADIAQINWTPEEIRLKIIE
jgi:hypothetical protein